jgi:DNA repair exonuclease SbcCD ATPase subunit
MNLFVAISDVHISLKNLDVSVLTLTQALNRARELKVDLVIPGDLNDGKAIMRSEWVKALIDLFTDYSDVTIHILIGNHDLDNKNSESNSLYFLRTLKNVILYDRPCMLRNTDETDWGVIPYQTSVANFLSCVKDMNALNVKNLIIHQGILGAFMGEYVVDETSISPEELSSFDMVISGHYHRSQKMGDNIYYCGSPFTTNFGEANETKFIWVVEKFDGKIVMKPELTNARRHYQLEFTSASATTQKPEYPDGSLLKVVVRGTKEFVKSQTLEKFQSYFPNVSSISIVPEIDKQSENRISADIIHQPLKVIDVYLQNCVTDFNKDKLKSFLLEECAEVFQKYSQLSSKTFKILSVEAENFLSFKQLKYEYSPLGLTLLEGYDEDLGVNTGAGKSTFLDAPVYGLFGETSKNLKSDEVLNRLVNKDLKIVVSLQGEDGVYKVVRYRKHHEKENDLVLISPTGQEIRGKDNRETQKIIEQTIGCSFEVFLKSTYFTQFGSIDRFLSSSDTEKKKLISEITDLSIYDELIDCVKKATQKTEALIASTIRLKETAQSNIVTLQNEQASLIKKSADWLDAHSTRLKILEAASKKFEDDRVFEIDDIYSKSSQFLINKQMKINSLKQSSEQWINTELEKKQSNQIQIQSLKDKIKAEQDGIDLINAQPKIDIADEKKKIQDKLNIIQQLEVKISSLQAEYRSLDTQESKLIQKITAELKKKDDNLGTDCSFCHQPVSSEHIDKHVEVMNVELSGISDSMLDLKGKIEQIQMTIVIKDDLKSQLIELEKKDKKQYGLQFNIETHKRSILSFESLIKQIQNEIDSEKKNPFLSQIADAESLVDPYVVQVDAIKNKINTYIEQIEFHKASVNPFSSNHSDIQQKIDKLTEQCSEYSHIEDDYSKTLQFCSWWKTALHVYIKSYLMDSCLESINTIANEYLHTLFDGVLKFDISSTTEKGSEVKEKINVSIINNGDECSYQSLSGGERCRICLAVNLALAEVIVKSSGKSFNMIFLDEILNGLDASGKAQSMKLLKELERKYETIFVIDHAEEFKQLFSNSIMIHKKNKISSIV